VPEELVTVAPGQRKPAARSGPASWGDSSPAFGAGRSSFNARPGAPPVSFDRQPTPAERLAGRQRGALDLGLAPGDEVVHRQWGKGVVATVTGQGERAMAEVDFPGLGRKRLLLRYAPLTRP
jgi:DNA helicase-2/ATP-dependent DNA helicase PcrA